jgi:hypothetical protein
MAYAEFVQFGDLNYLINFSGNEPTREDFEQYLADMLAIYARHERVSFVFNAEKVKFLRAELRIRHGNWLKEHKTLFAQKQVGAAFVLPNLLTRFIFDAITFIEKMPFPHKVFADLNAGKAYSLEATAKIKP